MRIVICGDLHGLFNQMYAEAAHLNPDVILQLGDTGMFPNPAKADPAVQRHGVPEDFLAYYTGRLRIPIPTYLIKGNHEDFDFLATYRDSVHDLTFVPQGTVLELDGIRFGILGGNYSPKYFLHEHLQGPRRRHFTRKDMDDIVGKGFDVLLSHDGPRTDALPRGSPEITALHERVHPTHMYHGHHHYAYETQIGDTQVIGLDKVGGYGRSMVLYEH